MRDYGQPGPKMGPAGGKNRLKPIFGVQLFGAKGAKKGAKFGLSAEFWETLNRVPRFSVASFRKFSSKICGKNFASAKFL